MSPKPSEFMNFVLGVKQAAGPLENKCWIWQRATDKNGYGFMKVKQKQYRVHRIAYALSKCMHPDQIEGYVLHQCDNPSCCNPSHLFIGTQRDNVQDAIRKNRRRGLTLQQRKQVVESDLTHSTIAESMGVSRSSITKIKKGNHVE